jgi:hypothetical protein
MILADATSDIAGRAIASVITLAISTPLGMWIEHLRGRTKMLHDVAERYITDRRGAQDDDSFAKRLGAMQRAGVGMLKNDRQVREFSEIVVTRGCTDPFHESDLDTFLVKDGLPRFLNGASARGIALTDDMALYSALVMAIEEREQKEREKGTAKTKA